MKKSKPNFKTKLVYGLIVIVPVAVIIVILAKLIELLDKVAKTVGLHSTLGAGLAIFLSLILLLVICYGIGVLVHTKIGSLSFNKFEQSVLLQIPGYRIISNILKGFAEEQVETYQPALIQLGQAGTAVLLSSCRCSAPNKLTGIYATVKPQGSQATSICSAD